MTVPRLMSNLLGLALIVFSVVPYLQVVGLCLNRIRVGNWNILIILLKGWDS
jgi:hypothetical protein